MSEMRLESLVSFVVEVSCLLMLLCGEVISGSLKAKFVQEVNEMIPQTLLYFCTLK